MVKSSSGDRRGQNGLKVLAERIGQAHSNLAFPYPHLPGLFGGCLVGQQISDAIHQPFEIQRLGEEILGLHGRRTFGHVA